MPYLAVLGMLALWLTPALVARAEEPPSTAPTPPAEVVAPVEIPVEISADYPEDFSPPDEIITTRENRYEAFGEDDILEHPAKPAVPLDTPLE